MQFAILFGSGVFSIQQKLTFHILKPISSTNFPMVPKDRIELSADPYQGSVLPLNYIGR